MAGTEGTAKTEVQATEVATNKEKSVAGTQVRKYFLPETGEVIEAASALEAAKLSSKANKGNEG